MRSNDHLYIYIYIYVCVCVCVCVCVEMVDFDESDQMIKNWMNQTLTTGLLAIFRSLFTELIHFFLVKKCLVWRSSVNQKRNIASKPVKMYGILLLLLERHRYYFLMI